MHRITFGLAAIVVLTSQVVNAAPSQPLKAIPDQVAFGTFNTLEEVKSSVVIRNTGKDVFVVEAIKTDCSCMGVTLTDMEIPSQGATTLEIATMLRTEGEFSHDILIVPKDRERYIPLRIQVKGKAIQPATCAIGWEGGAPVRCDPTRATELAIVHRLSVRPTVYLAAKNNRFDMRDAVIDVNSTTFELYEYRFVPRSDQAPAPVDTGKNSAWLVLTLAPKQMPKIGVLRDLVRVTLAPNVNVHIPLSCRVVGDVYAEVQRINLGDLASSEPAYLSVHFANGRPRWKQVKWSMSGYLSEAVTIEQVPPEPDAAGIRLKMTVDPAKLTRLPTGYLFARVTLYQNELTDADAITVLIDGTSPGQGRERQP